MHLIKTLLTFLFSAIISCPVFAETLKLPSDLPEVNTTSSQVLGTREDNIGLAPGDKVPDFMTSHFTGSEASFEALRKNAPLLVIFYRGGWCPYCNMQIRQLSQAYDQFRKRGVTPVLVSADKPEAAALAANTYEIPFPVLSDPELKAHEAFRVVMKLEDKLIPVYKEYGIVLEDWSGKGHHKFAVASAFIVDKNGVVKWAHSSKDYKTRPSVGQLLDVIDSLQTQ